MSASLRKFRALVYDRAWVNKVVHDAIISESLQLR